MVDTIDLTAHVEQFKKYYEPGILVPENHYRLVMDIDRIAQKAHILPKFISYPMKTWCHDAEIEWVKKMKAHREEGMAGLVYVGNIEAIEDRMMAIAGACLRNYMDARFKTVQTVIDLLKEDALPDFRVLLIPNFFLKKDMGGDLPSWQTSSLLGMLYNRYTSGLYTVLYVQSLEGIAQGYGSTFRSHLKEHYRIITASEA